MSDGPIKRKSRFEGRDVVDTTKKSGGKLAISLAVLFRMLDVATNAYLAYTFDKDGNEGRWLIQVVIMALASITLAILSAVRQSVVEQRHVPMISFFLGFTRLQEVVELFDSLNTGTKTGALKLLLNAGAIMESVPSTLFQCYVGYRYDFTTPVGAAVITSLLSMAITLVSLEKQIYISKGFGKLPLLSAYSIILLVYRLIELPSRYLSCALFAAEFGWWLAVVLGLDLLVVYLIRQSTFKRQEMKARRSRQALNRSMNALNRSIEDLRDMGLLDEQALEVDNKGPLELLGFMFAWMLVYIEGVDPAPFLGLRVLETAAMFCLFILFGDRDSYQQWALAVAALFVIVYSFASPAWLYFRSHAAFLHPKLATPSRVQMTVINQIEDMPEEQEMSEHEPEPEPESVSESSSSESEISESSESEPEPESISVAPQEIVVVPTATAAPVVRRQKPKEMRTQDTQYNYDGMFVDNRPESMSPRRPQQHAPREKNVLTDEDETCSIM